MIVDNNPQIPSRIAWLVESRGTDPAPAIVHPARKLQGYGAEALAMPCNTAHHFAKAIRSAVDVPLFDMVALAVRALQARAKPGAVIGVLASPAIRITGIFDKEFAGTGLKVRYPAADGVILQLIKDIKRKNNIAAARQGIRRIAADLVEEGADMLLVACSELSLVSDAITGTVPIVDTIDVLAEACIAFSVGVDCVPIADNAA
jgi:aspartate racemase